MLDTQTTQKPSPTFDELARNFATPPKAYSPVPIWWWSGDTLTRERLRWQMERLTEGGVYNAVILNLAPTGPLYGSDPDDPPFLSEAWWTLFAGVCEDAETLGFRLWFYDQLGFSGANLQAELVRNNPNFSGESLESLTADGTTLSLTCPSEGQPLAAFFTTEAGERVRVALSGRTARVTAKEAGRLRLVYSVRRGFNYFSPAACRALLDTVHGAFKKRLGRFFGTAIVGSFQDELPNLAGWSADFAEAFRQRKGYDLLAHLAALWEGTNEQAERVRADYQEVRAALAEEAFFKPLFGWHERHGLVCGFDQQGPARAGEPLGTVQLYADYLRTHRWFGAPGSDHHGDSKIHSSLVHLYDRERVWIESFHSSGWGGTLEETFDWLLPWLGAGATLYDPHAVYYSTWGGWWEWAPPSTCWRQPYWRHYPVFAAAGRLSYLLSQGRHVCDIGVLHPTTTVQANLTAEGQPLAPEPTEAGSAYSESFKRTATNRAQLANDVYEALVGSMMFLASEAGVLRHDRRDFDVLDDASVQRGRVKGGGLEIADEHFRVIVLPACTTLEAATAEQLIAFVEGGGALIAVAERPRHVLGSPETLERLTALFEQGQATLIPSADDLPQQLQGLERRVAAPVPVLHRRIGKYEALFVPAVYPHASQSEDENATWLKADYSFDPARYTREIEVTVRGFEGKPELWDVLSGERLPVAHTRDGDRTVLTVPFDRSPAALLVWSDTHNTAPMPEKTYETVLQTLPDTWDFSLEPTLDNRYGDLDKPDFEGAPPVQTWAFSHSADEAPTEKIVQATFGCYGLWTGPKVERQLPEPATGMVTPLAEGWQEAVYSLERGIYKDALHVPTLGPRGHVPEEFLAFGRVAAGEGVQFCTTLHLEHETTLQLALGAAAYKRVRLNGSELPEDAGGYLQLYPVTLRAGANLLEFRFVAQTDTELRAYYALVRDPEAFRRPERLTLSGAPQKDSRVVFSHTFEIPFLPSSLRVQVAADAACAVRLNGLELGRQGGFDPYYSLARVQPYSTEQVNQGANTLEVLVLNTLAPYLNAVSPTHYVRPGQAVSGLFGPVRLLT